MLVLNQWAKQVATQVTQSSDAKPVTVASFYGRTSTICTLKFRLNLITMKANAFASSDYMIIKMTKAKKNCDKIVAVD